MDEADNSSRSTAAAVRKAKKENRPGKITEPLQKPSTGKSKSKKKPSAGPSKAGAGKKRSSAFDEERGAKKGRSNGDGHEGMRAKRVKVNLSKGPKSKGRSKK
jgi:ATP-dependent RNA helicase DDX27